MDLRGADGMGVVGGRFGGAPRLDAVVVGLGFCGLATLANLVRDADGPLDLAVVAPDLSGHGLAYGTRDLAHRLNVRAELMGAWADDPGDFLRWVNGDGASACAELCVPVPGPKDFAPRALYARYLTALRAQTLREARASGVRIAWHEAEVSGLRRDAAGWTLRAGEGTLRARSVVLCTGNEPRAVFGDLSHRALHPGPWRLTAHDVARRPDAPVVLIGTGLTAVDALLTVRSLGFDGEVVALSRSGRLPQAHCPSVTPLGLRRETIDAIDSPGVLRDVIARAVSAGHDVRCVVDGLRPHTVAIWQRFSLEGQREAIARWSSAWGAVRHRLAPPVAARVAREVRDGGLRVAAVRGLHPSVEGEELVLDVERRDGVRETLRPAAVVDCTGPQLDWSASARCLRRGLLDAGLCTRHPTGLGLVADDRLQVGPGLFATGSALTGQRWETIAVPELRGQAATIAAQLRAPVAVAAA